MNQPARLINQSNHQLQAMRCAASSPDNAHCVVRPTIQCLSCQPRSSAFCSQVCFDAVHAAAGHGHHHQAIPLVPALRPNTMVHIFVMGTDELRSRTVDNLKSALVSRTNCTLGKLCVVGVVGGTRQPDVRPCTRDACRRTNVVHVCQHHPARAKAADEEYWHNWSETPSPFQLALLPAGPHAGFGVEAMLELKLLQVFMEAQADHPAFDHVFVLCTGEQQAPGFARFVQALATLANQPQPGQAAASQAVAQRCRDFERHGHCRRGQSCRFSHTAGQAPPPRARSFTAELWAYSTHPSYHTLQRQHPHVLTLVPLEALLMTKDVYPGSDCWHMSVTGQCNSGRACPAAARHSSNLKAYGWRVFHMGGPERHALLPSAPGARALPRRPGPGAAAGVAAGVRAQAGGSSGSSRDSSPHGGGGGGGSGQCPNRTCCFARSHSCRFASLAQHRQEQLCRNARCTRCRSRVESVPQAEPAEPAAPAAGEAEAAAAGEAEAEAEAEAAAEAAAEALPPGWEVFDSPDGSYYGHPERGRSFWTLEEVIQDARTTAG
jgi:hypothetical protein